MRLLCSSSFLVACLVSIHAPREGCDSLVTLVYFPTCVSIHAPREGCDEDYRNYTINFLNVSIHAPREGCDARILSNEIPAYEFQFTHPGRGATRGCRLRALPLLRFNSRTPGGVRLFSVHSFISVLMFQFTHPGRGATPCRVHGDATCSVSIHAPREGCDDTASTRNIGIRISFQFTHPGRGATAYVPPHL